MKPIKLNILPLLAATANKTKQKKKTHIHNSYSGLFPFTAVQAFLVQNFNTQFFSGYHYQKTCAKNVLRGTTKSMSNFSIKYQNKDGKQIPFSTE